MRRLLASLVPTVVLLGGVSAVASGGRPAAPTDLTVELQPRPMAIESVESPRLSWVVDGVGRAGRQVAYQLRVATSEDAIAAGSADTWDSGKVASSLSSGVAYGGPLLKPQTRYWWSVRTWTARSATPSAWAEPATFGTAVKDQWQATPVWLPGSMIGADWTDYTVETTFTVKSNALGLVFRATDTLNYLMWQFRGDTNVLRPHRQVNGSWSIAPAVALPMPIGDGRPHRATIRVNGDRVVTSIDDIEFDDRIVTGFDRGTIGFRTGNTESATIQDVTVTGPDGQPLYTNDFNAPSADFACGPVASGSLTIGNGSSCLAGADTSWTFLRKDVRLRSAPIRTATLYATGRSSVPARQFVFRLSVNGEEVGVGPIWHPSEKYYAAWDVTRRLRRGEDNTLAALAYSTRDQRFLAQLVVDYADGERQIISTGGDWMAYSGRDVFPPTGSIGTSYFNAPVENLDARAFPWGYDEPGFDDSAWTPAVEKRPMSGLVAQQQRNVVVRDQAPVSIRRIAPGHFVVDFGRTWVGGLRLTMTGTAGQTVELRMGEEMAGPDAVRYQMRTGNTYRDRWTLREGAQTLKHWGYRVFRYAEIIGAPDDLERDDIRAAALLYPYREQTAGLSSSDDVLDSVWEFTRDSVDSLRFDLYYDSPTRERGANNAGDTWNIMQASSVLSPDRSQDRLSLEWAIDNLSVITEWRMAAVMAARDHWMQTGDDTSLRRTYDRLTTALPDRWINADGLVSKPVSVLGGPEVPGVWLDLADWPVAERDGYVFKEVNTAVNAWSYGAYVAIAQIADHLGKTADAERYTHIAQRMRHAINDRLWDADAGAFRDGLGTDHHAIQATVYPVAFGVTDETNTARAGDYIASRGMACSVFCANYLLKALAMTGHHDEVVERLTDDGLRSWRNMMRLGAGATMEAWDPSLKPNTTFSHMWASAPVISAARDIFGITPTSPAYEAFRIAPRPGSLDHATITVPTVRGEIRAGFDHTTGGELLVAVWAPGNTTLTASIQTSTAEGLITLYVDHRPRQVVVNNGVASVDGLAPGCHTVTTDPRAMREELRDVCADGAA